MQKTWAIAILTAMCASGLAATAHAQFWPGYGYYGGYGAWGAYAAGRENAATRSIAQQEKVAGRQAATQQMAMMQSGIRNTLNTQAEMRTQGILSQQQSNRDWWYGVEQQQAAQRQMATSRSAASAPSTGMVVAAARMALSENASADAAPVAQTDIIKWPPVLCEPRFAEQRAMVEAPYYRAPKGPANPTVEDYESMIKATDQMKILLGEMTSDISAQVYLHAEKFLDQLAAEARGRIEKSKP